MLNKWLMLGGIVLASLVYGSKVKAEGGSCPDGYYPIGGGGVSGCAPIPTNSPRSNPGSGSGSRSVPGVLPKDIRDFDDYKVLRDSDYGYSFIAVAMHPDASDVWATWNQRNEPKAVQTALSACTQVMGKGCYLIVKNSNISAAVVRGRAKFWHSLQANPEQAREEALRACRATDRDCEFLHTFVSEPLKQPKTRNNQEYAKILQDPAFDVSKSYTPNLPRRKAPLKELSIQEPVARIATSPTEKAEFETLYGKILFNEPQKGLWTMKSKGGSSAKQCGATFFDRSSLSNGLVLIGPNQAGKGAILFQGAKLPKTDREKQIQAVLTLKGQQPGTVNAALIPAGGGSRVLVLADMVTLMRAAKGSSEVTLQLDGKEVFRSEVHGLTEVGSAMLECMGAQS